MSRADAGAAALLPRVSGSGGVPPGLSRLVPGDVRAAAHAVGRLEDLMLEAGRLGIAFPSALDGAVAKRRREYLAGRIGARLALRGLLGADAGEGGIGADDDDVPLWPEGVVGSISHGAGVGFAAVAPAGKYAGLGVDVERVVSPEQAGRLGRRVLNEREMNLRQGSAGGLTEAEMFTLAFSAKESAYKALFPVHRRVLGFSDVEVERRDGVAGTDRSGRLRLRATIDREAGVQAHLVGWYAIACDSGDMEGAAACRLWTLALGGLALDLASSDGVSCVK